MTSTMQTMFNLLMNKEEDRIISVAHGYKIIGALFDRRMDLDEARSILRDPVYYVCYNVIVLTGAVCP